MKNSLPKPRGKDGQLLAEPSEYGLGLSSRMVWSVSSRRSVRMHHVYHWGKLVGLKEVDLIEVIDVAMLCVVGEKMVYGVLIDWTHTH